MKKVRIIGAGFSGLSLAFELSKLGIEVQIIETSEQAGGLIASPLAKNGIYETGANAFLSNQRVENFVKDLGLTPLRPKKDAKKRFLYRSHPQRWPLKILETLNLAKHFLWSLVRRQLKPRSGETIDQWGQRNLGKAGTQFILEPALQGIYAGDSKFLSAELIFHRNRSSGRNLGLVSFEGGMGEMINKLVQVLTSRGVQIKLSSFFDPNTTETMPTVICTSPGAASMILKQWPELIGAAINAKVLQQMEMRPLTTVTAFFTKSPSRYAGFGILFPKSEKRWPLGILQNSNIFKRQGSAYSETWIIAGTDSTEDEIKSNVTSERQVIYNETQDPLEVKVTRWPEAIPHYTVEHKSLIEQLVPMNEVWLHGNYLGGIGLSKILARSETLAQEIKLTLLK